MTRAQGALPGTDWELRVVTKVTDGDTIRVIRCRRLNVGDGLVAYFIDDDPYGKAIRLITLDTPERGEPGYAKATADVVKWLDEHHDNLMITTWPGGGFDRLLGDVWVKGDRSNTLSQHMLRDLNWLPYVEGV